MKRVFAVIAALCLFSACSSVKDGGVTEETDSFEIRVIDKTAEETDNISRREGASDKMPADTAAVTTFAAVTAEETDDINYIVTDGGVSESALTAAEDNVWELELHVSGNNIAEGEPFSAYALLTYTGDEDITVYSSFECVSFVLEGDGYFGGGQGAAPVPAVSEEHHFGAGDSVRVDYRANGGWSADDPDADFYESFFDGSRSVILPPGNYRLIAAADMAYDTDYRDRVVFKVSEDITVYSADKEEGGYED